MRCFAESETDDMGSRCVDGLGPGEQYGAVGGKRDAGLGDAEKTLNILIKTCLVVEKKARGG